MPRDLTFDPNPALPADVRSEPTLREFLAFCRGKPAGEVYTCTRPDQCALAQFGFPDFEIPSQLNTWHSEVLAWPYTFGALASRLEAPSC